MITYLRKLTDERDSLTAAANDLTAQLADRESSDPTDTERASLAAWATRCAELDGMITEYSAQAESQRAYARLRTELDERDAAIPTTSTDIARRPNAMPAVETRTWGDLFTESDAFANYEGSGSSRRVTVPFDLERRAAIMVGNMPPGTLPPYTYSAPAYTYSSPLLDVVGKVTTSSNAVQWVTWSPNPQAAAPVVPEGDLKPEAAMTPAIVSDTLDTYAHFKAVTRQALEDIPQVQSIVTGRLQQGIVVALEEAVTDALQAAPVPPANVSVGGSLLEAIRSGVAIVQAAGYSNPNAVLLNPADWAALDIATIGNAGGATGQTGFWGMRAVSVPALAEGTAYVGDFNAAVQLFTRGSAEVFMSDSHADYFIRNIIAILAETRALATVPTPAAAAKCSVDISAQAASGSGGK